MDWYFSSEYGKILPLRKQSSSGPLAIVQQVPEPRGSSPRAKCLAIGRRNLIRSFPSALCFKHLFTYTSRLLV